MKLRHREAVNIVGPFNVIYVANFCPAGGHL